MWYGRDLGLGQVERSWLKPISWLKCRWGGQTRLGSGYGTHTRSEWLGGYVKGTIRKTHWDRAWRRMFRISLGKGVGCGMRVSYGWGRQHRSGIDSGEGSLGLFMFIFVLSITG